MGRTGSKTSAKTKVGKPDVGSPASGQPTATQKSDQSAASDRTRPYEEDEKDMSAAMSLRTKQLMSNRRWLRSHPRSPAGVHGRIGAQRAVGSCILKTQVKACQQTCLRWRPMLPVPPRGKRRLREISWCTKLTLSRKTSTPTPTTIGWLRQERSAIGQSVCEKSCGRRKVARSRRVGSF